VESAATLLRYHASTKVKCCTPLFRRTLEPYHSDERNGMYNDELCLYDVRVPPISKSPSGSIPWGYRPTWVGHLHHHNPQKRTVHKRCLRRTVALKEWRSYIKILNIATWRPGRASPRACSCQAARCDVVRACGSGSPLPSVGHNWANAHPDGTGVGAIRSIYKALNMKTKWRRHEGRAPKRYI
jgi:hypothetical protein